MLSTSDAACYAWLRFRNGIGMFGDLGLVVRFEFQAARLK
jgi:hypothetical protein